jgi:hypothetical protein
MEAVILVQSLSDTQLCVVASPDKSGLAVIKNKGLAITREVTALVKKTGKTRYNS